MRNNKFYLEIKDQRKGLLMHIEGENCTICTYNYNLALNFNSRYLATKYINQNKLNNSFKAIQI
jgi:hypothetical protein